MEEEGGQYAIIPDDDVFGSRHGAESGSPRWQSLANTVKYEEEKWRRRVSPMPGRRYIGMAVTQRQQQFLINQFIRRRLINHMHMLQR